MHSLTYLTLDKDVRQLRQSDVDVFALQISGGALSPADDAYNEARHRTAGLAAGTADPFDNAANLADIVKFLESIDTSTQPLPIP